MPEMVIRPTMKFIMAGYAAVIALLVVIIGFTMSLSLPPSVPSWAPWLSALLLVWPIKHHLSTRFTKMSILDDKLRYETGFLSKTTRTILVSRIQDLTVRQRAGQRIFGVGDLSVETSGETSSLTIQNIDNPQGVADHIHALSEKWTLQRAPRTDPGVNPAQ